MTPQITFDEFCAGKPIHYMGSDDIEYITKVERTNEVCQTVITRADGDYIAVRGNRRSSKRYLLPVGKFSARMQYDEALRYLVKL